MSFADEMGFEKEDTLITAEAKEEPKMAPLDNMQKHKSRDGCTHGDGFYFGKLLSPNSSILKSCECLFGRIVQMPVLWINQIIGGLILITPN